ncbi:hypothetical protein AB0J35_40540 [Nonomuraea angiospora]|uniref:hypothetical protein n=1 Tax=Nonomuraea angiospora TaxID=46172 RepID=UPI00341AA01E
MCVRFRGLRWALDDAQAGVGEDRVEGIGELAATVADQELQLPHVGAGVGVHEEVTGGLGGPRASGVGGDAEQVGPTAAVFEHDQGVQAFEVDGVDGDDVLGLGGQELLPRRPAAARSGVNLGLMEDVPHGRSRDLVAEAGLFTVDASVAMRRIRALIAAAVGGRPGRRRLL